MLIQYGSFMYFFYIFIAIGLCVGLYFTFRKKSDFAKKILIFSIMAVNFLQHIFKNIIYPQYRDWGFSYANTIYNMCAFLIVISPFVFVLGNKLLKDFIVYVGSFAGMIAICVPYWYIGGAAFGWEQFRFYLCHTLLFVASMLMGLLGLNRPSFKNFYKIPFVFFFALIIITINDIITIALGIYGELSTNDLYGALNTLNPVWSFHPNEDFGWLEKIISALTPNVFLGGGEKPYVPILWYAIPVYLFIAILAFIIGAIIDKENFKIFVERCKEIFEKIKVKIKKVVKKLRMFKKNNCEVCAELKSHSFKSSQDLFNCLQLFQKLLESGDFEFISGNFELNHPKNDNGYWQDDLLYYRIRCKKCGREYCCSCDTYHGHGNLYVIK